MFAQKSRGSPSFLLEEGRGRFSDVILWTWIPNKNGVNQKSITIQGHTVQKIPLAGTYLGNDRLRSCYTISLYAIMVNQNY